MRRERHTSNPAVLTHEAGNHRATKATKGVVVAVWHRPAAVEAAREGTGEAEWVGYRERVGDGGLASAARLLSLGLLLSLGASLVGTGRGGAPLRRRSAKGLSTQGMLARVSSGWWWQWVVALLVIRV